MELIKTRQLDGNINRGKSTSILVIVLSVSGEETAKAVVEQSDQSCCEEDITDTESTGPITFHADQFQLKVTLSTV